MSHSVMLTQLANSGWTQCSSIARALTEAGIPVPTEAYLRSAFDISVWDTVATSSTSVFLLALTILTLQLLGHSLSPLSLMLA